MTATVRANTADCCYICCGMVLEIIRFALVTGCSVGLAVSFLMPVKLPAWAIFLAVLLVWSPLVVLWYLYCQTASHDSFARKFIPLFGMFLSFVVGGNAYLFDNQYKQYNDTALHAMVMFIVTSNLCHFVVYVLMLAVSLEVEE